MSFMNSEFPNTSFYLSDLRELLDMYKKIKEDYIDWGIRIKEVEDKLSELETIIAEKITDEFNKQLPDAVRNELEKQLIKLIIVGISEAGYIIYEIPESWADIKFGTSVLDTNVENFYEYGHLVLSYNVGG